MSSAGAVDRYLAASRLAVDAGEAPAAAVRAYADSLARIVWTLNWPDQLTRPELLVTFTANARAETVSLADNDVIVLDTRLGSVFRDLTTFTMGDSDPQVVVSGGYSNSRLRWLRSGPHGWRCPPGTSGRKKTGNRTTTTLTRLLLVQSRSKNTSSSHTRWSTPHRRRNRRHPAPVGRGPGEASRHSGRVRT